MTDLDKLDAAYAATTQGEWELCLTPDTGYPFILVNGNAPTCTVQENAGNGAWGADIHNAYPALRDELRALRELVAQFVEREECSYDHHGYCQAHSLHEKPCPHERAKKLLGD